MLLFRTANTFQFNTTEPTFTPGLKAQRSSLSIDLSFT